ncbi:MAG TPA: hypothetical protein PLL30_14170 [Candidatus Krumholzibacteria bacterium]|nr:hypothetical protein [Candidatus Krumholzibacteria bacterium]HPD72912.1 hypothetical protein [Candidatus Krumholzibacteria bacterium]HRY41711.1 hypothetical protein [Candidatus Krumholzibacteria bacterium]
MSRHVLRVTAAVPVAIVAAAAFVAATVAPAPAAAPPCGPYLGQPLPGPEPALFAPGWINHGPLTRDLAIAPGGREICFVLMVGGFRDSAILSTRQEADGCWTEPEVLPFATDPRYHWLEPHFAADGRRLYFVTDRPVVGDGSAGDGAAVDENIWVAERDGDGWMAPRPLPTPVNTDAPEYFPSLTRDGTLYFTRRAAGAQREVILRARPDGAGGWREPETLPEQVNAAPMQFNAFVDPDERYLIVCLAGHPENLGQADYWIVFRGPDDTWRGPVNLGDRVNGPDREGWSPYVTPDGRAFVFMSARDPRSDDATPLSFAGLLARHAAAGNGHGHLWWVDAAFLAGLRPARD